MKNYQNYSKIEKLEADSNNKNRESDILSGAPIGYGFVVPHKEDSVYEGDFSKDSEVILASDGLTDLKLEFEGGKRIEELLIDFIKEKKSNKELKLIDYIKKSLAKATNIVDDITVIEVGSDLKQV